MSLCPRHRTLMDHATHLHALYQWCKILQQGEKREECTTIRGDGVGILGLGCRARRVEEKKDHLIEMRIGRSSRDV